MKLNVRRNMRMNSVEPMTRGWPAHDDLPGGIVNEALLSSGHSLRDDNQFETQVR
jgi:hypothetical protein